MFRADNRHPVDKRILLIDDIEEFGLWSRRKELEFSGLMWNYPESLKRLSQMARRIAAALNDEISTYFMRMSETDDSLRRDLNSKGIDHDAIETITRLSNLFHLHVMPEREDKKSRNQIRVNSTFPEDFHSHITTLSFAFSQVGSLCCTGNKADNGVTYEIEPGKVIIFDETVWHKAGKYNKSWDREPRVNLVI
ncbi:MAG: hypothetical protein GC137_09380 [Alphaproteobacteria bacterium]|nr:hypothetical protein [Alphaproteobacteria bacterium]